MMYTVLPFLFLLAAESTYVPVPQLYADDAPDYPKTWSLDKARLGKHLFFEKKLSKDCSQSCATCHKPELSFTDGLKVAIGVGGVVGSRNTPSIVNRTLGTSHFWDGRAATLAEQAVGPMFAENEMAGSASDVVRKLGEDAVYRQAFQKVYGGPVTMEFVVDAIVAYEMSVYVIDTPFDRYSAGDASALTPAAQRGMALFRDKARCAECHAGINFTDEDFHVLGVSNQQGRAVVTGKDKDVGAYKTPSLRNVALTAPYMHDGSVATLEEVIELYDRGGNARENLDKRMTRLNLTAQEKADLVAFMHSLTGTLIDLDGRPFSSSGLPQ